MRAWRPTPAAIAALVAVYVLWGSTAPAIRVAVATLPPWSMAAVRFAVAGTLLWFWCRVRRVPLPRADECYGAIVTGLLLLVLGNGVFTWCMQYLPSGSGALFFSLSPIFMAITAFALFRERIAARGIAGLVLGLGGMALLAWPSGAGALPAFPTLMAVLCSVSWAVGSIVQRRFVARDVVQASAMQMLSAAVILSGFAVASREHVGAAELTPAAIGAFAFLVVGGSIVGYSCYLWLLRNVPTGLASTYGYVNPVVALAIGVLVLGEPFGPRTAVAAAVIIAGVAMMISAPAPGAETAGPPTGTAQNEGGGRFGRCAHSE